MAKTKRDIETNRQISIIAIVILSIIFVAFLFIAIIFLFSKTEASKKIESIQTQIDAIDFENSTIEEEIEEYNEKISSAADSKAYISNIKEEYKANLSSIEDEAKKSDGKYKIAYLNFIVTDGKYLNKITGILNDNEIISNFYTNNNDLLETISEDGHLIGLYINDLNKIETASEDNKEIIETYDIDLYMLESSINDTELKDPSLKQVKDNSTSEGKSQLTKAAYADNIVKTTADRSFLVIRINGENSLAVEALPSIISGLKEKGYIFLPLISSSSIFD